MSQNQELIGALSALVGGTQDTAVLQQVTKYFGALSSTPDFVTLLCSVIHESERPELRQISALLLRRKITSLWPRVDPAHKNQIKTMLLERIMQDSMPIRRELARVIGHITKAEVNSNEWPTLVDFVIQASQSGDAAASQTALVILSELSPYHIDAHFQALFPVIQAGLSHADLSISSIYVQTLTQSGQLAEKEYEVLLPAALRVCEQCLRSDIEDMIYLAFGAFELLLETKSTQNADGRAILQEMITICLRVIDAKDVGDDALRVALEFLGTVAESRPKMLTGDLLKSTVIALFNCAIQHEVESDEDGNVENSGVNTVYEDTIHQFGRVAEGTVSKYFLPTAMEGVMQAVQSPQAHYRATALHVIGSITSGCAGLIVDNMDSMLDLVLPGTEDPTTDVRAAAMGALRQFGEELQPNVRRYYPRILPIIFRGLEDQNEIVKGNACFALQNLCEDFDEGEFVPYLNDLMPRLFELVQSGRSELQGPAITAISAAAKGSGVAFAQFGDSVLSALGPLLQVTQPEEALDLRAAATDCIGSVYASYKGLNDPSKYASLNQVMDLAMQGFQIDHSALRESTFGFFATIAKFMGEAFNPYLAALVELCTKAMDVEDHEEYQESKDDALDNVLEADAEDGEDGVWYSVFNNDLVTEKTTAITTIGELALACPQEFQKHLANVVEAINRTLKHRVPVVRASSVVALGKFALSTHSIYPNEPKIGLEGNNDPLHPELADCVQEVMFHIVKRMGTEISKLVVSQAVSALTSMLKTIGPLVFLVDGEDLTTFNYVGKHLLDLLKGKAVCQDPNLLQDEDEYDEGGAEDDDEDHDRILIDDVTDLLGAMCSAFGANFAKDFGTFLPPLLRFCRPIRGDADKAMGIGTIATCVDGLGEGAAMYADKLIPVTSRAMQDESFAVARNAAYATGLLLANCGTAAVKHFSKVVPLLSQLLQTDITQGHEAPAFVDNVSSAVARLMMAHASVLPIAEMIPEWLKSLPIRADYEEAPPIIECLSGYMMQGPEMFASSLPHLTVVIASLAGNEKVSADHQQKLAAGFRKVVATVPNAQATVQEVGAQCDERAQQVLAAIMQG